MNWKKFKNSIGKENIDESHFILGIDMGNDSSSISYFNVNSSSPEVIDISGGYGKPSIPTVMQYIPETKEWVYGEYALLNKGSAEREITLNALMERLGRKEYVDIDSRSVSIVNIIGLYIRELIGNIKNINPKAEIIGIVVSTPDYTSEEAKEELFQAFKYAGYEKELICLTTERECVLARYYFENKVKPSNILVLDFGSRELRGGMYRVLPEKDKVSIKSTSSLFEKKLNTSNISDMLKELFREFYSRNVGVLKENISDTNLTQIDSLVYQYKDLLFQKNIALKPVRIYFNFAYPPFQYSISKREVDAAIKPFVEGFYEFINKILKKNVYESENSSSEKIDTVICHGGGFEMLWVKKAIKDIFPDSNIKFYKNSKTVISEGASIIAAEKLDIISCKDFIIEDLNQIKMDLGVMVEGNKRFIPIVERNSFWWQKHKSKVFLLNEGTVKTNIIEFYKRDSRGELKHLINLIIDGLPIRPKGTTKIQIDMSFKNHNEVVVSAKDYGFGELFPKVDYEKKVNVHI